MRTYERVADLPVRIDSCALEGLELRVSPRFLRRTTLVRLRGAGEEGVGEDVNYDADEQLAFQRGFDGSPLVGRYTLDELSRALDALELFPVPPSQEAYRDYRRWAFESAALDLALRQAGRSLASVLEREPRPVRFAASPSLGEPASLEPLLQLVDARPEIRFKLDATPGWTDAFVRELAELERVDVVDFKGAYRGTIVDQDADPALYRRVAEAFPRAWLEDPRLVPAAREALAGHEERITWDAPLHSLEDVVTLERAPRCINSKPSRFGALARVLDVLDHCAARGIAVYGGGQFELGVGRGQVQLLASLFHPDAPNDVAPRAYHAVARGSALPASPLNPRAAVTGFRWDGE